MTLERVLEPEVMDTLDEARDYDDMDHSYVNRLFVDDLLATRAPLLEVLDLGTGTARIPIELCRRVDDCRVMAVDAAAHMLDLAHMNIEIAGLGERIQLARVDAKQLPFADGMFPVVMSNSIVHHIPSPRDVLREAIRVLSPGGLLFFRDLARPDSDSELARLVQTYAGSESEHGRTMFANSLRAALTVAEVRSLVVELGCSAADVQLTSDRHWTWQTKTAAAVDPRSH